MSALLLGDTLARGLEVRLGRGQRCGDNANPLVRPPELARIGRRLLGRGEALLFGGLLARLGRSSGRLGLKSLRRTLLEIAPKHLELVSQLTLDARVRPTFFCPADQPANHNSENYAEDERQN